MNFKASVAVTIAKSIDNINVRFFAYGYVTNDGDLEIDIVEIALDVFDNGCKQICLTRKDYIKLAKAIQDARLTTMGNEAELQGIQFVTKNVVKVHNPQFDLDRFLVACK